MKPQDMTNEQLAAELLEPLPHGWAVKEAARRLQNTGMSEPATGWGMDVQLIEEKARRIFIEHLLVAESVVTKDAHIRRDLGADSLDEVELLMAIECQFEIEIPDTKLEQIKTFGDVVSVILDLTQ